MQNNKNKIYIIFSLVLPIIYSIIFFIWGFLGYVPDNGQKITIFSYLFNIILFIIYTILGIYNFILFFKNSTKKTINILMLIFNTIHLLLIYIAFDSPYVWGYLLGFYILSGCVIGHIIVYSLQIRDLLKILKDK